MPQDSKKRTLRSSNRVHGVSVRRFFAGIDKSTEKAGVLILLPVFWNPIICLLKNSVYSQYSGKIEAADTGKKKKKRELCQPQKKTGHKNVKLLKKEKLHQQKKRAENNRGREPESPLVPGEGKTCKGGGGGGGGGVRGGGGGGVLQSVKRTKEVDEGGYSGPVPNGQESPVLGNLMKKGG